MINFFKNLFGKKENKNEVQHPEMPENSLLKAEADNAWKMFKDGNYEEAISMAALLIKNGYPNIHEANSIIGLSYFRQHLFDKAQIIFEAITKESEDSDDWFNLVTSSAMNNNVQLSEHAFEKTLEYVKKHPKKGSLPIPNMHFFYMQALKDIGEYEKAFVQLTRLGNIYATYGITDTTFLYMRGVPMLSQTLDAGKQILEHVSRDQAETFFTILMDGLDEYGKMDVADFRKTIQHINE
ncbi:MAG: hypothetical protein H7259_00495 [Cytophagales bacterium]|nr:hypothetical protein [Cytophaga sp.]